MKFMCDCGETLIDQTDALPFKGYLLRDVDFNSAFDRLEAVFDRFDDLAVDAAPAARASLRMRRDTQLRQEVRRWLTEKLIDVYQCPACGRLHVFAQGREREYAFLPEMPDTPHSLLETHQEGDP